MLTIKITSLLEKGRTTKRYRYYLLGILIWKTKVISYKQEWSKELVDDIGEFPSGRVTFGVPSILQR